MKKICVLVLLNSLFMNLQAQNFEWSKREGQGAYDYGKGIATDNSGNVYVAGKYEQNANFSGTILPCQGNHDIYVVKYDANGSLIWVRTAGGVSGDYAHALACDGSYVYVAGEIEGFGNVIKFIGSPITLTSKGVNDAFLAKYDLDGSLIWAKEAGGFNNDEALGITYDNAGNVFICGFFNGTATFETTTVNGHGANDIYVAKYDSNGQFQWVRTAGSVGRDEAKGIKCDASGNVYVCGTYKDGTVFGSQVLTSPNGYFNAFLAKYTPDGTLAWVKTAGGDYDDVAYSVAIDNSNKIYITGEFNSYAHFDGLAIATTGSADVFVACYDASGNIQWVKGAGGTLIDRARAIGCDGTNLYITGQFGLSANFDSSSVTGIDSSEIFIAKLNNAGVFQWAKSVGGPPDVYESLGYEAGDAICAEPGGNVYAAGALLNGGLFGSTSFNTYGRTDVFITKITQSNGTSISFNQTLTLCVGQSLIVGTHTYTASGNYTDVLTSSQSLDSIVTTHLTVLPSLTFSQTKTICAGQNFTVGTNTYAASGNYTDVLISHQNCDSTVTTHLTVLPAITFSQTRTICSGQNFTVGAHTYAASGNYTDILISHQNCDSTVTTHLTVSPAITFSQTKTICAGQNFTVGTHTHATSGNYTDVLISHQNCDSTVTTHLTVLPSITFSQNITVCAGQTVTIGNNTYSVSGNYTDVLTSLFSGCDSTVITQLKVLPSFAFSQNETLCAGQTITIGSNIYSASGDYTDVLISHFNGCDSIVKTHLIVNSVDKSVSVSNSTLTANASNATYQWINCNNGNALIAGQTSQSFSSSSGGNYAVVVTQNSCTDTSACYAISINGIVENSSANIINIYPNPNTGIFTLEFCFDNIDEEIMMVEIFDPIGKSVYHEQLKNNNGCFKEKIELDGGQSGGVFILKITSGKLVESRKLLLVK